MQQAELPERVDVVVIGGGLWGLAAAVLLGKAGHSVVVLERASHVGGRGMTQEKDSFYFNLGGHALYRGGIAYRILRSLGIEPRGHNAPTAFFGLANDRIQTFPVSPQGLFTTPLLDFGGKVELLKFLATLGSLDPRPFDDVSLKDWLDTRFRRPAVRQVVGETIRVATYCAMQEQMSAGAALAQLKIVAQGGAFYIDHGWQTLVDGLVQEARLAGVRIHCQANVEAVEHGRQVRGVRLKDGRQLAASHVVIANSPAIAAGLLSGEARQSVQRWADAAIPVNAACFDVALSRLPRPEHLVVLDIERPFFYSTHSAVAKLAPSGGALIHMIKHLKTGEEATAEEFEALLDRPQPGWRDCLVHKRFMPHLAVSHAAVTARAGGTSGRPGPAVPDVSNLYVVGDWVGGEGMLVDASMASAEVVARLISSQQRIAQAMLSHG